MLPLCALKGCTHRVKNKRHIYCSHACSGLAHRDVEKPVPWKKKERGPGITINPERFVPEEEPASGPSFWTIAERQGFTRLCGQQKFSQSRKALYLYHPGVDNL